MQAEKLLTDAQQKMKAKNKAGALSCMRRRKYQLGLIETCAGQLENLQRMVNDIEMAQMNKQAVEAFKAGNAAMKELQKEMDLEMVEDVMADMQDGIAWSQEVADRISQRVSPHDEDALEAELREMAGVTEPAPQLPDAPTADPVHVDPIAADPVAAATAQPTLVPA